MQLEQPQAIRTLFFDVGFTLLYPFPSDQEICQQVCARQGLHLHLEQLANRFIEAEDFYWRHIRANRQIWASDAVIEHFWLNYYMNLLRPFVDEHDKQRLRQLAEALNEEYNSHTSWQMYPDVLPTLEALRTSGRYTLAAISDWGFSLGPILQRLQLNTYFEHMVASALIGCAKPAPLLYETALTRANSIADYSLHIGDSYTLDVLGARAVGMTPILLDRKRHLTPDQVDCLLIHSLSELLQLLEIKAV